MSTLVPFSFENQSIRVITTDDGEPLFVAKDVAVALGYADPTNAVKQHCKGVAEYHPLQTKGGMQEVRVIREPDLYRLIASSQLPAAQEFERLVFEEILPTIRKTGKFVATPEAPKRLTVDVLKIVPIAARAAKAFGFTGNQAALSIDRAVTAITGSSPLALMGQTQLIADQRGRTYTPTELGKMADPPMSGQKVNKLFEEHGIQVRDISGEWSPLAQAAGLFELIDTGKRHHDGAPVKQMRWFVEVLDKCGITYRIDEVAA